MKIILFLALLVSMVMADNQDPDNTNDLSGTSNNPPMRHHRLSFEYSFSNLKDDTKSGSSQWIKDYNGKLTSGSVLGASWTTFWPDSPFGMGVCVSKYWSSATQDDLRYIDTTNYRRDTIIGTMSDDISIVFFGLPFGFRKEFTEQKIELSGDIRIGGMFYFDEYSFADNTLSLSSPTFGFGGNIGVEYKLGSNVGLFFGLTGLLGSVTSLYVQDGDQTDLEEPISLNRLDINIGLRIHFETDPSSTPFPGYQPGYQPPMFPR